MPESVHQRLLGKRKRTLNDDVIRQKHLRDYTFSEVKGGTKGERADYMLIREGNDFKYVPIVSKVKLNKKR